MMRNIAGSVFGPGELALFKIWLLSLCVAVVSLVTLLILFYLYRRKNQKRKGLIKIIAVVLSVSFLLSGGYAGALLASETSLANKKRSCAENLGVNIDRTYDSPNETLQLLNDCVNN